MQPRGTSGDSHPDESAGEAAHGFQSFYWIILAVATYLLALGPAVKLHRAVPQSRPAIAAIYFWVEPAARASPQLDAVLRWYVYKVWRVK